jgi:cell division protein ZapA (FtsZ GTPase activity inhibitor)
MRTIVLPRGRVNTPHLRALLALPEFAALQQFLTRAQVDLDQLQAKIDQLVEQVRRHVEEDENRA